MVYLLIGLVKKENQAAENFNGSIVVILYLQKNGDRRFRPSPKHFFNSPGSKQNRSISEANSY